jgi:hypothetical protein
MIFETMPQSTVFAETRKNVKTDAEQVHIIRLFKFLDHIGISCTSTPRVFMLVVSFTL